MEEPDEVKLIAIAAPAGVGDDGRTMVLGDATIGEAVRWPIADPTGDVGTGVGRGDSGGFANEPGAAPPGRGDIVAGFGAAETGAEAETETEAEAEAEEEAEGVVEGVAAAPPGRGDNRGPFGAGGGAGGPAG